MNLFLNNPELLAVAYGLASAAVWGAGDFSGGFAAKRGNVYAVVLLSQVTGLVCLLTLALLLEGPLPSARNMLFGALAGLAGVIGILSLYAGLARGRMGVVAPTTAVLSASIPVVVGIVTEGIPPGLVLVGFGLAVTAVWLLSGGGKADGIRRDELGLALLAGLGFSLFFVFIDQLSAGIVFWPLTAARAASVPLLLIFLLSRQWQAAQWQLPNRAVLPIVALSGILDSGGNYFFALATQSGRLDIAAVLSSLYPASTVLLARLILKERLGPRQWLGVGIALVALVLIAI
ncbi:EamA family transporter [Candidatus Leptofilum sp.]|uniref:EamA family transporter n=1 Tax=Candidatus Leptofilum sp. TaxID=3241576 RepID=UPI003B5948C9